MVGVWCKDKTFKVKIPVYLFSYTLSYFWWGGVVSTHFIFCIFYNINKLFLPPPHPPLLTFFRSHTQLAACPSLLSSLANRSSSFGNLPYFRSAF